MNYLKKHELRSLLSSIPDESNRLMILVGFWHGLRVSEIISLTGRNIQDGYLIVQRSKKSKRTIQPFITHKDTLLDEATPLLALAKQRGPDEKLFTNIGTRDGVAKLMQRAGALAGIPRHRCHPHALKHSIAMVMHKGGKGIKEIQTYLGHVEGKNTLVYLEATEEEAAEGIGNLL